MLPPDGLNAAFYKFTWSCTGKDLHELVVSFYNTGNLPNPINSTHIVLIPKINCPNTPRDFRPISLCNVTYKIIAKTLANRIKNHLPHIIHPSQTAFVQGRHIALISLVLKRLFIPLDSRVGRRKLFF
jgi:hypothetical protein